MTKGASGIPGRTSSPNRQPLRPTATSIRKTPGHPMEVMGLAKLGKTANELVDRRPEDQALFVGHFSAPFAEAVPGKIFP